MATKKKAKGKTKSKRKKSPVTEAKAPRRKASPKKARAKAKAAIKSTPASPPARPAPMGKRIGVVTHYFGHVSVAIVRLESGTLRVGDMIHIQGHTTDFKQKVESLEVDHAPATEVGPKDDFGLKVVEHAREHDVVFKVRS
jgi:translation elongation factor EF-Tu-like GTPase